MGFIQIGRAEMFCILGLCILFNQFLISNWMEGGGCLSIFIKQKIRSVDLLITYVKKLIFFKVEKKMNNLSLIANMYKFQTKH